MGAPLVSLIVLNWNGASLLEECIGSLMQLQYKAREIIVVDNASKDSSIEVLNKISGIRIIQNQSNLGYAGGNNVGFNAARGVYVATLNNDIIVEPTWLDESIELLESNARIGIISGRQMNYFNRDVIDALYSFLHPSLIFFQAAFRKRYNPALFVTNAVRVLGASGASSLYRKKMLDELDGFDESLFAYHEESDLCMRAFLAGWHCAYVPSAVSYHRRSVTFNRVKPAMFYYQTRNRLWFIYKYSPLSLIAKNFVAIIFTELRIVRVVLFRERVLISYCKGIFDGLRGIPGLAAMRRSNLARLETVRKEFVELFKHKYIPL